MDADSLYLKTGYFGLGDAIVEGWHFFRKDFWKLLAVSVICFLPIYAIFDFTSLIGTYSWATPVSLALIPVSWFNYLLSFGTIGFIVSGRARGEPVGLGKALHFGLSRWGSVFGSNLLSRLVIGVLSLLLIVPGVLYLVYYSLSAWAAAMSNQSATDSLEYSKNLVKGHWWRVCWVVGGLNACMYGLTFMLILLFRQGLPLLAIDSGILVFLTCLISVMTAVFFLNIETQAALPAAGEPDEVLLVEQEEIPPQIAAQYPVVVSEPEYKLVYEPSSDSADNPPAEPAAPTTPRNNAAAAGLALALVFVVVTEGSFLTQPVDLAGVINKVLSNFNFSSALPLIEMAFFILLLVICAVALGIGGLRRAAVLGGKGKWPALSSLGLSLGGVALLAILIFMPRPQTFSTRDLSLSHTSDWIELNTANLSVCQDNSCVVVLNHKDDQTFIILYDAGFLGNDPIESLDEQVWENAQLNGSLNIMTSSYLQVDGRPASRRTYTQMGEGQLYYVVMGLIQAKSTLYQYIGVSQTAASHQAHLAEVDQIIQSIHFKE